MASINDVYNQLVTVNAALSSLNADVTAGTTATNAVNASVEQLDADLKGGFASTVDSFNTAVTALNSIWAIDYANAQLLYQLTQQANSMICALEHVPRTPAPY